MAALTIPAAYLEDVRVAAEQEVADDMDCLRAATGEDRAGSVTIVRRATDLLGQLYDVDGDVQLTADQDDTSDPLVHVLEAMVRQLIDRMQTAAQYGPIPMTDVLECAEKVRWAAQETIRIDPSVAMRLIPAELLRRAG